MKHSKVFLLPLLLLALSGTAIAQDCVWSEITIQTVNYGRDILIAKPAISRTQFKDLMSKRLTAAKAEHSDCPSREHRMPAMIVGSCAIKNTLIAEAVRADFLDPRGSYWGGVLSR